MRGWLGSLLVVLLAGCSGADGPTLYNLHGTVKYDGAPVPYGRIEFEPDTTKGNSGGLGYAEIIDGKYDTSLPGGRGVIGGPHLVRFTGQETKPAVAAGPDGTLDEVAAAEAPPPKMLFSHFTQEHDLPQEDGAELNFDLPPDAAFTLKVAPAPRPGANDP